MTEGVVPVSGLYTRSGSEIPEPRLTFEDHGTYGKILLRLEANGLSYTFDPAVMLRVGLFQSVTKHSLVIASGWVPTITEVDATRVVTLAFANSLYPAITVTVVMTPVPDGYSCTITVGNTDTIHGVEWVGWPRLACKAHSGDPDNAYLAYGFVAGAVLPQPHNFTFNDFLVSTEAPSCMQFWDYYDAETKVHLYVATDDDDGYAKRWNLNGDNSSVSLQEWMHHVPNPLRAHNGTAIVPYTFTYTVRICLFRGLTEDGRCGAYDAALRYSNWASNETDRPWLDKGPWDDVASNVSSRVRASDFYYSVGPTVPHTNYWTDIVQDMTRLQSFLGITDMMGFLYSWGTNQGTLVNAPTFLPPSFLPLNQAVNQNTALGTAAAASIHLSWYTIPQFWESYLTGAPFSPFRYDDFEGTTDYGAIAQYVVRDVDDAPVLGNFDASVFPPPVVGP